MKAILQYSLIPDEQCGFLLNKNTGECIQTLIQIYKEAKSRNCVLHTVFIDFKKAFDSCSHSVLKQIFNRCKFGKFGHVLSSLLENRTIQISTAYGETDKIHLQRGVPQGDVISPLLFILFLAPLNWTLKLKHEGFPIANSKITHFSYADDLVLFSYCPLDIKALFNSVVKYCDLTGIEINPSKCAYTINKPQYKNILKYKHQPIPLLNSNQNYKYLGLPVNLDLKWGALLSDLKNKYLNLLDIICKKFYLGSDLIIKLINMVLIPKLAYSFQFFIARSTWHKDIAELQNKNFTP